MDDAIITAIISGVFSIIVGFISGYSYCIKNNKKYNQKAKNDSTQIQIGDVHVK